MRRTIVVLCLSLLASACGEDDPQVTGNNATANNASENSTSANNATTNNATASNANNTTGNNGVVACGEVEGVYRPGAEDGWPACVSDGGAYVPFEVSVSTSARIAAFEAMADLLWRNANEPSVEDFAAAYEQYALGEGLLSRVSRREDEHYPPVTDDQGNVLRCRDAGVPERDPARCVGPATMVPLINAAFEAGLQGTTPRLQAARIEATLLWFLYLSTYKEAVTCSEALKDCDSSFAYYTGGEPRTGGTGLSAYYRTLLPEAHESVFDALLGVRCWRDVDQAVPPANTELRALAYEHLDRGLLQGFAAVVLDRIATWENATGVEREAAWAALKILGQALVREALVRDATEGEVMREQFSRDTAEGFDASATRSAVSALFTCF